MLHATNLIAAMLCLLDYIISLLSMAVLSRNIMSYAQENNICIW